MRVFLSLLALMATTEVLAQNNRTDQFKALPRGQQFKKLDANRDGSLTRAEFAGHPGNFRALDCNQDGLLTESEYVNRFRCEGGAASTPPDAFTAADADRDGVITRQEWYGSADDFNRYDRDNDGRVTRDEHARPLVGEPLEEDAPG